MRDYGTIIGKVHKILRSDFNRSLRHLCFLKVQLVPSINPILLKVRRIRNQHRQSQEPDQALLYTRKYFNKIELLRFRSSYTSIHFYATLETFYDCAIISVGCQWVLRWSKLKSYSKINRYWGAVFVWYVHEKMLKNNQQCHLFPSRFGFILYFNLW